MDWKRIRDFVGLTPEDLQVLRAARPLAEETAEQVATSFYDQMARSDEMMAVVRRHTSLDALSKTLARYFLSLFDGKVDEVYVQSRIQLGRVHHRVGVPPEWYGGMLQVLQSTFLQVALQKSLEQAEAMLKDRHQRHLQEHAEQALRRGSGLRWGRRWGRRGEGRPPAAPELDFAPLRTEYARLQRLLAALDRLLAFDHMVTLSEYTGAYVEQVVARIQASQERVQ